LIPDLGNFSLEVSSPGIGRILKSRDEYDIFQGKAVSILTADSTEWIDGIIERADQDRVYLNRNGEVMDISFDVIKKARLDFSQQEGK
jgi:ribosome maturation factor RimP